MQVLSYAVGTQWYPQAHGALFGGSPYLPQLLRQAATAGVCICVLCKLVMRGRAARPQRSTMSHVPLPWLRGSLAPPEFREEPRNSSLQSERSSLYRLRGLSGVF